MKNSRKITTLNFEKALEIVINSAHQLGAERISIEHTLHRVLAEDVISDIDMPPFNKATRDGYACRRVDLANELRVIETIPAGHMPQKSVGQNQCAKIMTGAVVPEGADCVIMTEYTKSNAKNKVQFSGQDTAENICVKGENVRKGDVVLRAGTLIKPQHIAVLVSCGCVKPLVTLQLRVGIIATGSELVEPDKRLTACQIRNSNGFQLAAQVANVGAIIKNYGIAPDTIKTIDTKFKRAIAENNVVILSGGVSRGDYDFVQKIFENNNIGLLIEAMAIKPGWPVIFGVLDKRPPNRRKRLTDRGRVFCFGLPGNPVSSFITFELFVRPFLYKMAGHNFRAVFTQKQLKRTIRRKNTEKDSWQPVVFKKYDKVANIEYRGSGDISALCRADGLLRIPAGVSEIKKGTVVNVRLI